MAMDALRCERCGQTNPPDARFCNSCGTALESKCPNCGRANPPGSAFCIFWGHTPASRGGEIRAASPVNVFGRIEGDPRGFGAVTSGTAVRVEQAGE